MCFGFSSFFSDNVLSLQCRHWSLSDVHSYKHLYFWASHLVLGEQSCVGECQYVNWLILSVTSGYQMACFHMIIIQLNAFCLNKYCHLLFPFISCIQCFCIRPGINGKSSGDIGQCHHIGHVLSNVVYFILFKVHYRTFKVAKLLFLLCSAFCKQSIFTSSISP